MRVERSGKPASAKRACYADLDGSFRPAFLFVVYKFAIPFDFAPADRRARPGTRNAPPNEGVTRAPPPARVAGREDNSLAPALLQLYLRYLTETLGRVLNKDFMRNFCRRFPHTAKFCASMPVCPCIVSSAILGKGFSESQYTKGA
jgi:hypothetical protein